MKKSIFRILICLTLVLSLIFTLSACGKSGSGEDTTGSNEKQINAGNEAKNDSAKEVKEPEIKDFEKTKEIKDPVKEESADFLKVGLAGADVTKKLGKPENQTKPVKNTKDGLLYSDWLYTKQGIKLNMVGAAGKETIKALYILAPSKFQTTRKIGIGSTLEDVEKAYSGNINKDASHADFLVVGEITKGIMFQLDDGKVNQITIAAYQDK